MIEYLIECYTEQKTSQMKICTSIKMFGETNTLTKNNEKKNK